MAATAACSSPVAGAATLEPVSHNPLLDRGFNSTIAIGGGYAYIGSFGDSTRPNAGPLILSLADPRNPQVVGRIPPQTGRFDTELRLWRRKRVLAVIATSCNPPWCVASMPASPQLVFYDVSGAHATNPVPIRSQELPGPAEDLFLWQDPQRPDRALLYVTTVTPGAPNIVVYDISRIRSGRLTTVDTWTLPVSAGVNGVHTVSTSPDGRRAYVAAFDAGYFVLNTAQLAKRSSHARIHLLTPLKHRVTYAGVNGHSAIGLPGGRFALISDEISGCPWGWTRIVDVANPKRPRIVSEARVLPYNDPSLCTPSTPDRAALLASTANQTFSAHDETATCGLVLASWYGSGVQAFARNGGKMHQIASLVPRPLGTVQAENPNLLGVTMHSQPTISGGLIYVVDIRNGLYVLRYRGPHQREVSGAGYLSGNSNLSRGGKSLPPAGLKCRRNRSSSGRR